MTIIYMSWKLIGQSPTLQSDFDNLKMKVRAVKSLECDCCENSYVNVCARLPQHQKQRLLLL